MTLLLDAKKKRKKEELFVFFVLDHALRRSDFSRSSRFRPTSSILSAKSPVDNKMPRSTISWRNSRVVT